MATWLEKFRRCDVICCSLLFLTVTSVGCDESAKNSTSSFIDDSFKSRRSLRFRGVAYSHALNDLRHGRNIHLEAKNNNEKETTRKHGLQVPRASRLGSRFCGRCLHITAVQTKDKEVDACSNEAGVALFGDLSGFELGRASYHGANTRWKVLSTPLLHSQINSKE
jgi:hypothetical protein